MEYKLRPLDAQASLPTVTLPVTDDLPALAGQDYLAVVNSLFVKFEQCAILAARNCGVSCDMPTIVIPPTREGSRSDRKSAGWGKRVTVRIVLGWGRVM